MVMLEVKSVSKSIGNPGVPHMGAWCVAEREPQAFPTISLCILSSREP